MSIRKELELEIMIRYRVPVAYANLEETLDHLRENGAADIVSVRVPKGSAKALVTKILEGSER